MLSALVFLVIPVLLPCLSSQKVVTWRALLTEGLGCSVPTESPTQSCFPYAEKLKDSCSLSLQIRAFHGTYKVTFKDSNGNASPSQLVTVYNDNGANTTQAFVLNV